MCLLFSSTCLSLSTYRINEKLATCKMIHPSSLSEASIPSPGLHSVTTHCAH